MNTPVAAGAPPARAASALLRAAFGTALAGNTIGAVGFPLFVLDSTGSTGLTGAAVTVAVAASVLTGLLMGPVLDRWGMRRSWLAGVLVGLVATVALVVLHRADALPGWALLALTAVRAAADEPGRVAAFGLLPRLAAGAGGTLERANATLRAMSAVATIAGPVVAGALVATAGTVAPLLVDAAAGVAAVVLLAALGRLPGHSGEPVPDAVVDRSRYRDGLREALRYLRGNRVLRALVVVTALFATLDSGLVTIGLTSYADRLLGDPAWYGGLAAAFGAGALVGTVVFGLIGHRLPRRAVYLTGYLTLATVVALLPWCPGPATALLLVAVAGVLISPVDLIYMQELQERVPPRMFGTVAGTATTVVSAPGPAGVSLLTWALATGDVHGTFVVLGAVYALAALPLLVARPLRALGGARPHRTDPREGPWT
jgi:MFS family permease